MSGGAKAGRGSEMIPGFTMVPDVIFDWWMGSLTGAEMKIVNYLARRIYGFQEHREAGCDKVSINQLCDGIVKKDGERLDCGTGLSRSTLFAALVPLVQAGLVERIKVTRDNGGSDASLFRLNIHGDWRAALESLPAEREKQRKKAGGEGPGIEPPPSTNRTTPRPQIEPPPVHKSDPQQTVGQQTGRQQTAAAATRAREEIAGDPPPSAASEPVAAAADTNQPSEGDGAALEALLGSIGINNPVLIAELCAGRSLEEMRFRVEDVRKRSKSNPCGLLITSIRAGDGPPQSFLDAQKRRHAAACRDVVTAARSAAPPGERDPVAYVEARPSIGSDEKPAERQPDEDEDWRATMARLRVGTERERARMEQEEAARAKALRLAQQAAGIAA